MKNLIASIPSRNQAITKFKREKGRIAAVLPIHYSRALLRAFDYLPVEVWGPPLIPPGQGGRHLQSYVCSICHNALSFLYQGGLDVADLILVPHACDSLQGLGSVLLDFVKPSQPVIPLYIPRDPAQYKLEFLAAEFRTVYDKLVEVTHQEPSEAVLIANIEREEAADDLLLQIHQHNAYLPLSNTEIYQVIRCREYLPAEIFIDVTQQLLAQSRKTPRPGIPILIEGIVPEPPEIFDTLTELGAAVVGDDLASCRRRLYPHGNHDEPFLHMAERILNAPPDPTRGSSIMERKEYLLNLVNRTGAKGIIFYIVKFCEPEAFDIPILRHELKMAGLASIVLEFDLNTQISQQIRTRLGAFMEMLQ